MKCKFPQSQLNRKNYRYLHKHFTNEKSDLLSNYFKLIVTDQ